MIEVLFGESEAASMKKKKNKIYKFIAFDDNEKSNLRKLECLRGDML